MKTFHDGTETQSTEVEKQLAETNILLPCSLKIIVNVSFYMNAISVGSFGFHQRKEQLVQVYG